MKRILAVIIILLCATPSLAVNPDEMLRDSALELRARSISANLRCLVCQNQSIDDSDAGLARDLRLIVRERLSAGDSDQQVYDFVVARYGNFVLLKPPFQSDTLLLWLAPVIFIGGALFGFLRFVRKANKGSDDEMPLGDDEKRQLAELENSHS